MSAALEIQESSESGRARRFGVVHIVLIILGTILVTVLVTLWVAKSYLFPSEFKPVTLSQKEEQVLDEKLRNLDPLAAEEKNGRKNESLPQGSPRPERYSETGADREVSLTERELNALLAKNTDLARKLAVDLSDDLVSARLLVPMDPDFPVLGGKILKVRAGLELSFDQDAPVVALRGISIMGVPLPNAWIGGIKNINLVSAYGAEDGFWKSFAAGVETLNVEEGRLKITLKE